MEITREEILEILTVLKLYSWYDLTDYSEKSIQRRLDKVLTDFRLSPQQAIQKIMRDKEFPKQLVKAITVNTTELFRDPKMWQELRYYVYPKFKDLDTINVWHAGASTGQEVYSNAILLNELGLLEKTNLLATDINEDVLNKAKKGIYRYSFNNEYLMNFEIVINEDPMNYQLHRGVSYSKYMNVDVKKDKLEIKSFLKKNITYEEHDLINGVPIQQKFHLIFCRNVLIYFNFELQKKVIQSFVNNLEEGGVLFLGRHESILEPRDFNLEREKSYYVKERK
jgi:chemotaxis protein methyltransferase CheR